MICKKCKGGILESENFCPNCGFKVKETPVPAPVPVPAKNKKFNNKIFIVAFVGLVLVFSSLFLVGLYLKTNKDNSSTKTSSDITTTPVPIPVPTPVPVPIPTSTNETPPTQTNIPKKTVKVIKSSNYFVDEKDVFYITNESNGLHKITYDGDNYKKINNEKITSFVMSDGTIYFASNNIYSMKTDANDTSDYERIFTIENANGVKNMVLVEDNLYFYTSQDTSINKLDLITKKSEKFNDNVITYCIDEAGKTMYYITYHTDELKKLNKTDLVTGESDVICEIKNSKIDFKNMTLDLYDDYFYVYNKDIEYKNLYQIDKDGTLTQVGKTLLDIKINENGIFYTYNNDQDIDVLNKITRSKSGTLEDLEIAINVTHVEVFSDSLFTFRNSLDEIQQIFMQDLDGINKEIIFDLASYKHSSKPVYPSNSVFGNILYTDQEYVYFLGGYFKKDGELFYFIDLNTGEKTAYNGETYLKSNAYQKVFEKFLTEIQDKLEFTMCDLDSDGVLEAITFKNTENTTLCSVYKYNETSNSINRIEDFETKKAELFYLDGFIFKDTKDVYKKLILEKDKVKFITAFEEKKIKKETDYENISLFDYKYFINNVETTEKEYTEHKNNIVRKRRIDSESLYEPNIIQNIYTKDKYGFYEARYFDDLEFKDIYSHLEDETQLDFIEYDNKLIYGKNNNIFVRTIDNLEPKEIFRYTGYNFKHLAFYINDKYVYFSMSNENEEGFYRMDIVNNSIEKLVNSMVFEMFFEDEFVYLPVEDYSGGESGFFRLNLNTKELKKLSDIRARIFKKQGDYIYYVVYNRDSKSDEICKLDINTGESSTLKTGIDTLKITVKDNSLFYFEFITKQIAILNLDSLTTEYFTMVKPHNKVIFTNDRIFYTTRDGVFTCNYEGLDIKTIHSTYLHDLNLENGVLYFQGGRMDLDGSNFARFTMYD